MGQGLLGGVGQREGDVFCAEAGGDGGGLSVELDGWALAFGADDFDVAPADAVIPSGAEGFHAGFFGGEAGGVTFEASGFGFAIEDFAFGEDAVEKTLTETLDGLRGCEGLRRCRRRCLGSCGYCNSLLAAGCWLWLGFDAASGSSRRSVVCVDYRD